jgi:hypothetical protein
LLLDLNSEILPKLNNFLCKSRLKKKPNQKAQKSAADSFIQHLQAYCRQLCTAYADIMQIVFCSTCRHTADCYVQHLHAYSRQLCGAFADIMQTVMYSICGHTADSFCAAFADILQTVMYSISRHTAEGCVQQLQIYCRQFNTAFADILQTGFVQLNFLFPTDSSINGSFGG